MLRDPKEIIIEGKPLSEILALHRKWWQGEEGGSRAVLRDADLSDADLSDADLRGAVLRDADLRDADLRDADLRDAVLRGADLSDADLRDADLRGADLRGADLSDADLRDAVLRDAVLRDAVLRDADLDIPFTPDPGLINRVAAAALQPGALKMDNWHTCESTHCIAGWAVTLHPEGKLLERFTTTYLAARLLLGDEAAEHFFDGNEEAAAYLEKFLPEAG
jgi:hypothetical protein